MRITDNEARIQEIKDSILSQLDSYIRGCSDSLEFETIDIAENHALVDELCSRCMDIPN